MKKIKLLKASTHFSLEEQINEFITNSKIDWENIEDGVGYVDEVYSIDVFYCNEKEAYVASIVYYENIHNSKLIY